jgi:hypothetical protein
VQRLEAIDAGMDALVPAVARGDVTAYMIVMAVTASARWIDEPQPDTPAMCCLACNGSIARRSRSYAVVAADVPSPEVVVALAVCADCAPSKDAIAPALEACLRIIWPAYRPIGRIMDTSGRA